MLAQSTKYIHVQLANAYTEMEIKSTYTKTKKFLQLRMLEETGLQVEPHNSRTKKEKKTHKTRQQPNSPTKREKNPQIKYLS